MEKFFAVIFLAAVAFTAIVGADRCNCPVQHPQQKFCEADFVFVATVRGSVVEGGLMIYQMKVSREKVFKGEDLIDRGQTHIDLYTPYNGKLCGRLNLVYLEKYLISGEVVDGRMQMSFCNWVTEWENISPQQQKYLKKGTYGRQCGDCSVKGVFSVHDNDMNAEPETFHISQLSGKWSRYECTYNPVASIHYMDHDCENQFSYCTRDFSGMCMWKSNTEYDECFNTRETTWALRNPQQPAFTRVSQCRSLKTKRQKKKCLRVVRNHFRLTGGRAIEMPFGPL